MLQRFGEGSVARGRARKTGGWPSAHASLASSVRRRRPGFAVFAASSRRFFGDGREVAPLQPSPAMRSEPSTIPTPRPQDSERAYFGDLAGVPRFDPDVELELARAVVRTRRAYWTILLSTQHLARVLDVVAVRGKDETVLALGSQPYASVDVEALAAAIDRAGDEHAVSDALVALAADIDAAWHCEAERAKRAYLAARNRFVETNLRLVVAFASRCGGHLMPLVDRIQEGNIGLMKAVDRFDPDRGVRFSTYAAWWIRHAILRALSVGGRTVRIPPQIQVLFAKAERARRRLTIELGREPELGELAQEVGCEAERLEWALETMQLRSVSFEGRGEGESDFSDTLGDDTSLAAMESVADGRDRARAVAALGELPARDRGILLERFDFAGAARSSLREIGRRHGVSRERARQLQQGALEQLRRTLEPSRSRRLQPFR
jgi:RNA polymerase primary sigma factor